MSEHCYDGGTLVDDENTESVPLDDEAVYTGDNYSQIDTVIHERADTEELFDPDATFLEEGAQNLKHTSHLERESNVTNAKQDVNKETSMDRPESDSMISTQPMSQSQEKSESASEKTDLVVELLPSQHVERPMSQDDQYTRTAPGLAPQITVSSSSSSSQIGSSSSSSKRPTESEDTDDTMTGSQDMFASQRHGHDEVTSVSQHIPTLQLSCDNPSSRELENFVPPRLNPSSPTSGSTSTPLRNVSKLTFAGLKGGVISFSDEEDVQKLNEKRKHSDSSDGSKSEKKNPKKFCVDSRRSIEVVEEFNIPKLPLSSESEDLTFGSQCFSLHLSQSSSDVIGNQSVTSSSPPTKPTSQKSDFNLSKVSGSTEPLQVIGDDDSKTDDNDVSVVQIDDVEDEIQFVSPPVTKARTGEIVLDSPQAGLNTSGDVLVLSPSGDVLQEKKMDIKSMSSNNTDQSLLLNRIHNTNSLLSPLMKQPFPLVSQLQSCKGVETHDTDCSKENIEPVTHHNVQEFKKNGCILTFSCTVRLSCEMAVDMGKKEAIKKTVHSFEVLEKKIMEKRDSSPSAVEESSPSKGEGSPASVVSGPGPFPLQPSHSTRLSLMSTTSSSSAGSFASAHQPGRRGRGPTHVPKWKSFESSLRQRGLVPWSDLLCPTQDELVASTSEFLDKWSASCISNCSSDESKTFVEEEKGLDTLPEDDGEELLGVPKLTSESMTYFSVPVIKNLTSFSTSDSVLNSGNNKEKVEQFSTVPDCPTPRSNRRKQSRSHKSNTPGGTPKSSTKKKATTPKSKGSAKKPLHLELSSVPEDSISSGSHGLTPGCQVFALWGSDKSYYPGHLENTARNDQWVVKFHDGFKKTLSKNKIIVINTFEIGQSVSAATGGCNYDAGVITAVIPLGEGKEIYEVELSSTKKKVTVHMSDLCLSEKQLEQYFSDHPGSTSSNSSSPSKRASKACGSDHEILKNLDFLHDLPGKRVRTPKGNQTVIHSPGRPGPSNTARRLISDCSAGSSTAEDEPLAQTLSEQGPHTNVSGVEPEQVGFGCADPLARKGKGVKNRTTKKPLADIEDKKTLQELGPIPPEGSKLFAGFSFLVTYTEVKPKPKVNPTSDSEMHITDNEDHVASSDSSQYASDSECFKFTHYPLVKDRLVRQITQGGGKVLKHWKDILTKDINKTFVVSNRPCLTPTYIHCLARGIKSVMHDYIIDCCKQNRKFEVLQSIFLAVGYSYKKKDWVTWAEHKRKSLLQGEKIHVDGNDREFSAFWEDVLKIAGGNPSTVKELQHNSVSKVMAENTSSSSALTHAINNNIPVVSPCWLTQSLIANKPLPHDALPMFAYDYFDLE